MFQGLIDWLNRLGPRLYAAFLEGDRWQLYLQGLVTTLELTVCALIVGVALGVLVAVIRTAHDQQRPGHRNFALAILNVICKIYTTVIRVPSGFFCFAENCTLSENEHFASFSFFMPDRICSPMLLFLPTLFVTLLHVLFSACKNHFWVSPVSHTLFPPSAFLFQAEDRISHF